MKAMILAAGIGSRLKPITNSKPKALVELFGKSLLQIQLEKLKAAGINDVLINVHHFADQIIAYLNRHDNFIMNIHISDETEQLLDTGGALKKAAAFLKQDDFLLQNVDVVSDVDFTKLTAFHREQGNDVTLAVSERKTSRFFLFDKDDLLCGWKNNKTDEIKWVPDKENCDYYPRAFSGIHIIKPSIFNLFPEKDKFSIVDFYLATANKYRLKAFKHPAENWWDIGKMDDFASLSQNNQLEQIINS